MCAQFKELERIGYRGFAFGMYEHATELVATESVIGAFTPQITSYLHAILVAGMLYAIIVATLVVI